MTTPPKSRVRLVLVTGSGRSGTSTVAGALKRLGLHIPQPEVETDERNPRGYYEPRWVAEFHKGLLNPIPVRTIDTRPDAGRIAMESVTPEVEAMLREWLNAELALLPEGAQLTIKETRAYWVYDLWRRVAEQLEMELTSLTMLRHPTQVVRSRDSAYLTVETDAFRRQRETTNVAAWINAAFATEHVTRGNPRAFVPYYDLIGDWRAAMVRAGGQLAITFGVDLAEPHPVDEFIDTSLNRSADSWQGLVVPTELVDLAERTWTALNLLVTQPQDPEAMATLNGLRQEYSEIYEAAAAIAQDETAAQVMAARRELKGRLAAKNQRIEKLRAELEELRGRP